jgi:hypothetical protein
MGIQVILVNAGSLTAADTLLRFNNYREENLDTYRCWSYSTGQKAVRIAILNVFLEAMF